MHASLDVNIPYYTSAYERSEQTLPLGRGRRTRSRRRWFSSLSDDSTYVPGTELFVDGGFVQV